MITIQLQRQGVSESVRAWFGSCPHGEGWHLQVQHKAAKIQGPEWGIDLSYPNCIECFGPSGPRPEWNPEKETRDAWRARLMKWNDARRDGQYAWNNRDQFILGGSGSDWRDAVRAALPDIARIVGQPLNLDPDVMAYNYSTEHEKKIWPQIKDDVYLLCASYEPGTDTIRHEPTNICLIAFDGPTAARFDIDAAARRWRSETDAAYREFLKEHVQRDGEWDAKCWLAWLLSEYIRKGIEGYIQRDGAQPVRRKYIARRGDHTEASPADLERARSLR